MKKLFMLTVVLVLVTCAAACNAPPDDTETTGQSEPPQHRHTPVEVAARQVTCIEDGNRLYFVCADCGLAFRDEACQVATTAEAERLSKGSHTDKDENNVCDVCTVPLMPILPGGDDSTEMPKVEF